MSENKFWQLTEFSKQVDMHFTTINTWFDTLESKKIHYVNRRAVDQKKIYDNLDLKVGLYIKEKRDGKWSLDAIYTTLQDNPPFELRAFPSDYKDTSTELTTEILFQQVAHFVEREVAKALERQKDTFTQHLLQIEESASEQKSMIERELEKALEQQAEAFKKQISVLEISNKVKEFAERQQRITDMITQNRIESILELEALDKWALLPITERYIKTGFLRREEDSAKRQRFVRSYIQDNYEKRLNDEMKINELSKDE